MSTPTMRRFQLHRSNDVTGVSGTGIVAEGCQFADGRAVVHWLGAHSSTVVWDRIEDAVHVHGHAANTQIVWLDDADAAIAELDPATVWVVPKVAMPDGGWLVNNPRRSMPGWHVAAMSFGEDEMTSAEAREFAAEYMAAADECDRRNGGAV